MNTNVNNLRNNFHSTAAVGCVETWQKELSKWMVRIDWFICAGCSLIQPAGTLSSSLCSYSNSLVVGYDLHMKGEFRFLQQVDANNCSVSQLLMNTSYQRVSNVRRCDRLSDGTRPFDKTTELSLNSQETQLCSRWSHCVLILEMYICELDFFHFQPSRFTSEHPG